MSRSENKTMNDSIEAPLMKVNELINSIFAMNQSTMIDQLQTCSKIVSQLLQNELITHINSLGAAKLLCYELILMVAEQNAALSRPRLSSMENAFGNNKKIRLTASMRNTLASINEVLQQIVWKNLPRKRAGTQKNIGLDGQAIHQNYSQFKQLLADFDRQLEQEEPDRYDQVEIKSNKKSIAAEQSSGSQQNEALIEQLEQIVAKKQRRIKQLNQQLQENILEQKAQQDLISQLQSRNIDLKEEIRQLNSRLRQKDMIQIHLQDKVEQLMAKNIINERQAYAKKPVAKTEKSIKTKFTIDDEQQQASTVKKSYKDILDEKPAICLQCQEKKDISVDDINGFRRMLLTQALSIQALI